MTDETKEEEVATVELTEEDKKAVEGVKGRLEFFFSDANVRQDRFIRKLLMNDDKQVPIESLLLFNTIKKHTTKPAVIAEAAKELSDTLTLNEKSDAIRRVTPFTEELMDDNIPKSLMVKNLPLKGGEDGPKQYACTVSDVRAPFEKFGSVALVNLKWSFNNSSKQGAKKNPIGCAMVEFETKEMLEKAAEVTLTLKNAEAVEAKESITIGENTVNVMLLSEYIESRKKGKDNHGKKHKRDEEGEKVEEIKNFTFDWKPGCVIQLKGLSESCDREAILAAIGKGLDIGVEQVKERKIYADFSRGQTDGAIRFPKVIGEIVTMAQKLKDGDLEVAGHKVQEARILDGDEEKKYWDDFIAFKNKQIRHNEEMKRAKKKQKRQ